MKIIDSKLWDIGTKVYDLMIINLLWMIFSIPLITIGPAIYAGLKCIKELENGRSNNIFISYVNYFKENMISYALGFNTLLGVLIFFVTLLIGAFNSRNVIILSLCIFIILECVLALGAIFAVKDKNPIDLIMKSIIYGNRYALKVILNIIACICIIFIAINIPILMAVAVGVCMFISNKVLLNKLAN